MKKTLIIAATIVLILSGSNATEAEAPNFPQTFTEPAPPHSDPLFEEIAKCESHNDPLAKNPTSTGKGRFQFLDGTWKGYAPQLWGDDWVNKKVLDYDDNTDLAWFVYTTYGTRDWEADPKSYDCWKSKIPEGVYRKGHK